MLSQIFGPGGETMKLTVSFLVMIVLAACGASTVQVDWEPDAIETTEIKFNDTSPDNGNGGKKDSDTEDGYIGDHIQYDGPAVLEFYEPYGDDNVKCQGYAGPDQQLKIDQCYFEMSYTQMRTFKVVYFVEGQPQPFREINWELTNNKDLVTGENVATIDTSNSGTNPDGIAQVTVTTYGIMQDFVLKASAVHPMYAVQPLYFNIRISPKAVEPLTIKLKHEGAAIFDVINVYLFDQANGQPACLGMDPAQPPFPAAKSNTVNSVNQSVKFPYFPTLTQQNPKLTFTACAIASKVNGPPLAFGCDDESVVVEYGKSRTVIIVLKDVPPKYVGTYRVVNHFDMLSALPDNIEMVVNIIIDFFNNPTAGLMQITCILDNSALNSLCSQFFNTPEDPDINNLTFLGSVASQVLNSILYSLLADNIGGTIIFTGKDVGNILRDLEIWSDVQILQEPDSTGYFKKEWTREEWHTVSFQWTLGQTCNPTDPNCGLKSYSFNAIGQDVAVAQFEAQVPGYVLGDFDDLIIYPHPINFKYGAFLNFVIEKLVLPEVAGPGVDSYEKFFSSLVGGGPECLGPNNCCANFANEIAGQSGMSWLVMTLQTGCDALIPLGAAYLRQFLMGLDVSTGNAFTIGTPAGRPCTMYVHEADRRVRYFGKETPEELRCEWDVLLNLGALPVNFEAQWYGQRLQ
jgi:hypothetical protein